MKSFEYSPIDLGGPAFRLIILRKGVFMAPLYGELYKAWLDDDLGGITYEAISYTWGSTEKFAYITVDGSKLDITENLFQALQHVRKENIDRILWIDAICIDQSNVH